MGVSHVLSIMWCLALLLQKLSLKIFFNSDVSQKTHVLVLIYRTKDNKV